MTQHDPRLYLTHIIESIELARSYVAGLDLSEFAGRLDSRRTRIWQRDCLTNDPRGSIRVKIVAIDGAHGTPPASS